MSLRSPGRKYPEVLALTWQAHLPSTGGDEHWHTTGCHPRQAEQPCPLLERVVHAEAAILWKNTHQNKGLPDGTNHTLWDWDRVTCFVFKGAALGLVFTEDLGSSSWLTEQHLNHQRAVSTGTFPQLTLHNLIPTTWDSKTRNLASFEQAQLLPSTSAPKKHPLYIFP